MTRSTMILRLIAWLLLAMIGNPASAWHPLEPADTSSPRATISSFLALTDEAAQHLLEHRQSPSRTTQDRANRVVDKAAGLLELSQIPPAARDEVALDTLFLLREVVARIELPDWANFRILEQVLWKWIALLLAAETDGRFFRAAM